MSVRMRKGTEDDGGEGETEDKEGGEGGRKDRR